MIVFYSPTQDLHAPEFEFYRGERVPCFESPQRAAIVLEEITRRGHELKTPTQNSWDALMTIHSAPYLTFLQTAWQQWLALNPANKDEQPFPSVWPIRTLRSDLEPENFIAKLGMYSMDNGTPMVAKTWEAAKAGADAASSAARFLAQGNSAVFCATRPPGHHAGVDFMGGYCFLNNAAVAAQELLNNGCKQVAVLDVDFHHGNGTQSIFYDRRDVLFVSLHGDPKTEFPFYLGHAEETGSGAGAGATLNLPMPAGTRAETWFAALEVGLNKIKAANSEAMVVSLGLDTFEEDPVSNFKLRSEDYVELGRRLKNQGLPMALILEGGYATQKLGTNVANVLQGFEE